MNVTFVGAGALELTDWGYTDKFYAKPALPLLLNCAKVKPNWYYAEHPYMAFCRGNPPVVAEPVEAWLPPTSRGVA